jgi:hypothetical protein
LVCDNNTCITPVSSSSSSSSGGAAVDGTAGGRCYGNGTCNSGLRCTGSVCEVAAAGTEGGACYGNSSCNLGLRCNASVCERVFGGSGSSSSGGGSSSTGQQPGGEGGACYANSTCNLGLDCSNGTCTRPSVGNVNGACYGNGTCNGGLACTNNVCHAIPQGALGGSCYPNATCNAGLACSNGTCVESTSGSSSSGGSSSGGSSSGGLNIPVPMQLGATCDSATQQAACGMLAPGAQCYGINPDGSGVCLKANCNATTPCPSSTVCAELGDPDYCAASCNGQAGSCGAGNSCVNTVDAITLQPTSVCLSLTMAGCRTDLPTSGCGPGLTCVAVGTDGFGQCQSSLFLGSPCNPANQAECTAVGGNAQCVGFQAYSPDLGWCVATSCTPGMQCAGAGTLCVAAGTNTFCSSTCTGVDGECGAGDACVGFAEGAVCTPMFFADCRTDVTPTGCPANQGCVALASDGYGGCFASCDVFASACAGGDRCLPVADTGGVCLPPFASKTLGQACASADECSAGLACAGTGGTFTCKTICDATHACPQGQGACTFGLVPPALGFCE